MPRLFTAIEVPGQVAAQLSLLRGGLSGARWVDPENYHLTLRFIGDIDDSTAAEIIDALDRVRRAPFSLNVHGIDTFGGRKPRAVFAAVKPAPALVELAAEHERLIQRVGLPAETRKFTPHITIARLKNVPAHAVAAYLSARGGFFGGSFEVNRFVLLSSRASSGGGPYIVEAAYSLH